MDFEVRAAREKLEREQRERKERAKARLEREKKAMAEAAREREAIEAAQRTKRIDAANALLKMAGCQRQRRRQQRRRGALQMEGAQRDSATHEPELVSPTPSLQSQGDRTSPSPQVASCSVQSLESAPHPSPSSVPIASGDSSHVPLATPARGEDSRVFIKPIGDSFNPPSAVRILTDCIKQKFDKPCLDWLHAPKDHKDAWFEEFEKRCIWDPSNNASILRNFKKKGGQRLRGLLADARKDLNKRPDWVCEEAWAAMKVAWKEPSYLKKSQQNSLNRRSEVGGLGPSLYSGGSAPVFEHKRKLEKELNREPRVDEVFLKTHTKKDKSGFVDKRSEKTYQDFVQRKEQLSQSSVGETSSECAQPPPDDLSIWLDTVGGKKKGRIYGLGSEASVAGAGPSQSHQNTPDIVHTPEFQMELQRQVTLINAEWQAKMAQEHQQIRDQLSFLMHHMGVSVPPSQPTTRVDGSNGDDDQNDFSDGDTS